MTRAHLPSMDKADPPLHRFPIQNATSRFCAAGTTELLLENVKRCWLAHIRRAYNNVLKMIGAPDLVLLYGILHCRCSQVRCSVERSACRRASH